MLTSLTNIYDHDHIKNFKRFDFGQIGLLPLMIYESEIDLVCVGVQMEKTNQSADPPKKWKIQSDPPGQC